MDINLSAVAAAHLEQTYRDVPCTGLKPCCALLLYLWLARAWEGNHDDHYSAYVSKNSHPPLPSFVHIEGSAFVWEMIFPAFWFLGFWGFMMNDNFPIQPSYFSFLFPFAPVRLQRTWFILTIASSIALFPLIDGRTFVHVYVYSYC